MALVLASAIDLRQKPVLSSNTGVDLTTDQANIGGVKTFAFAPISVNGFRLGVNGPLILPGAGIPTPTLVLPRGSLYVRTDGDATSNVYLSNGAGVWIPLRVQTLAGLSDVDPSNPQIGKYLGFAGKLPARLKQRVTGMSDGTTTTITLPATDAGNLLVAYVPLTVAVPNGWALVKAQGSYFDPDNHGQTVMQMVSAGGDVEVVFSDTDTSANIVVDEWNNASLITNTKGAKSDNWPVTLTGLTPGTTIIRVVNSDTFPPIDTWTMSVFRKITIFSKVVSTETMTLPEILPHDYSDGYFGTVLFAIPSTAGEGYALSVPPGVTAVNEKAGAVVLEPADASITIDSSGATVKFAATLPGLGSFAFNHGAGAPVSGTTPKGFWIKDDGAVGASLYWSFDGTTWATLG